MEEKKQYSALTIDRAAFLLLRVKKAFKKKKLQRKERERNAQLAATRIDQRASCAGLESASRTGGKKAPPPLLRSRTLPAIVVPGVSILQAQLGNLKQPDVPKISPMVGSCSKSSLASRFHASRVSFSRDDSAAALDVRRKSAISRLCVGTNYGPEKGASESTLLLRVPAPHVIAAKHYKMSSPNAGSNAFNRLSKLLNQSSKSNVAIDETNVIRRLSWERRDTLSSKMPRSASIDSMVEAVWAESVVQVPTEKRSSLRAERTIALVSPSVGRRLKGQRSINELPTVPSECEMEVANVPPAPALTTALPPPGQKPTKKQAKLLQQRLDRLARVNIHLHALFAAVENGHLEKARTILESTDVDVNCSNNDGISPLDVAVLSNNRPLVKMLISFGAKEGNQCTVNPEKLGSHLKQLLGDAEMRLQEFGGLLEEPCGAPLNTRASFSSIIGTAYHPSSAMTGCAGGDSDKQAIAWGRRAKTLRRLVLGFTQARPPDPPSLVAVDITGINTVLVRLLEPSSHDSHVTTKYKVQWSTRADFAPLTGELDINDISKPSCTVELTQGRRYFFRAACGNLKGFGGYLSSTPASVVPSSWREVDDREERFTGKVKDLEVLTDEMRHLRPGSEMLEAPGQQRRMQRKKTTIKQLFTAASKFQKNLRRGIYLACILYHEDKVLVTNEDFLPVIEIDETFPSCIHNDLHWFMKVACNWDDTKSLKADMDKHSSSAIHFRTKLLSAALQMQSTLCLQDLGQLYYRPIKDSQGTIVLSTINYVKSPKNVSVLNSRWLPMNKVFKKTVLGDDHSISEILMSSIQEQINYHQVSSLKLAKGLYVVYLKMQSSVDLIQVVVPSKSPNMLPHCKIRDNPHVSAEEWDFLKQQHIQNDLDHSTEQQRTFLELVTSAAKRLFNYMDISNEEALNHRLYDTEIIDLTDEVSFIVICPSAELSCSVPGQREMLLQRGDLLSLPIPVFEMIHLNTYQNNIIQRYSRLNCVLELDSATANHLHREAFSNSEVAVAKERLNKLQDFQTKLNLIWRCARWLMEVIAFARDKTTQGISMKFILDKDVHTSPKRNLLQLPARDGKIVKSTPGRGSWPGPGASGQQSQSTGLLNEFSKSEQHLNMTQSNSQFLNASDTESRKNSDSYASDIFNECLVPSRSEDMLFSIPMTSDQRNRSSTISSVSATTSPLLNVRPMYSGSLLSVNTLNTTNTSDSMHSLSSDSDNSYPMPLGCSTPHKLSKPKNKMVPSRSMTNMKQNILEITTKSERYRPKHLDIESTFLSSNLDTHLSKSLTNIKNSTDDKTYLKPVDQVSQKQKIADPAFKAPTKELEPGILQVFAAYETGLASGTSLKLHVTPKTTAREVVDLVVKQLNMAVVLKGKDGPIYPAEKLKNFCLVAVIGARERCLRDDFKPLQLQNPWKKGRLYVRQKQDVLAALEHSSKHTAII